MHMPSRFKDNKNIRLFNIALDRESKTTEISIGMDRSSYERDLGSGIFRFNFMILRRWLKNVAMILERNLQRHTFFVGTIRLSGSPGRLNRIRFRRTGVSRLEFRHERLSVTHLFCKA